MRLKDIGAFFRELDRRIDAPVIVLVTGGAAAIIQGVKRATHDIDFELNLKKPGRGTISKWEKVQKAVEDTGRATGITPQYAEDIDRWSAIALPAKTSRSYLKLGKVDVRVLDPAPWAVGKLARCLASDVDDLRTVFKKVPSDPRKLARFWGKALGLSPASNSLGIFRRQVEWFFDTYARDIWDSSADSLELKKIFNRTAQQENQKKRRREIGRR